QRRPAKKDCALIAHNDRLIAHGRHVSSTRRTRTQNSSDLINTFTRHASLVVKDAPEMVAIGEHIRLKREERSAGIHEVKTRQAVLHCNFLRPQVLLHCDWEICTALHRSVICNKDGLMTLNHADARNETGAWRLIVVHAVSRERAE